MKEMQLAPLLSGLIMMRFYQLGRRKTKILNAGIFVRKRAGMLKLISHYFENSKTKTNINVSPFCLREPTPEVIMTIE